ncbi:hypothetical protein PHISCL_00111 [Aspergillus sclerotialis]|uniref:Rhodopsin domain-containing protein n=1 Tax=Aspergillus sclerotialis TaxID=2070753 RepID=A0A3A3AC01_9EURO|nr:hypothetical protein PHISCL_00111 [Aspergillus sclerotialis]
MIVGAVTNTIGSHEVKGPEGEHFTADGGDILVLAKLNNLNCILEPIALACIKISLLFFYHRIFINPWVVIWVLIGITIAWDLAFPIFQIAACWTQIQENFENEDCPWISGPGYLYVVVDVLVDTAILLLPMPTVFTMLVPWRRKAAVLSALLVGSLPIAYAHARMIATFIDIGPYDSIQRWSLLLILPDEQIGIGMIAVCLPILGPPIVRYMCRKIGNSGCWSTLFNSIRGSNITPIKHLASSVTRVEKTHTTLGSMATQDIEAYAKGRIRVDEEQGELRTGGMHGNEVRSGSILESSKGATVHSAL